MSICLCLCVLDTSYTVYVRGRERERDRERQRETERDRERQRETGSKRNPEIQPELSVAEFNARARVTGQRVMRSGGGRQSG